MLRRVDFLCWRSLGTEYIPPPLSVLYRILIVNNQSSSFFVASLVLSYSNTWNGTIIIKKIKGWESTSSTVERCFCFALRYIDMMRKQRTCCNKWVRYDLPPIQTTASTDTGMNSSLTLACNQWQKIRKRGLHMYRYSSSTYLAKNDDWGTVLYLDAAHVGTIRSILYIVLLLLIPYCW